MHQLARSDSVDQTAAPGEPDTVESGSGNPKPVAEAIRRFQAGTDREASFRTLFEHYHDNVERFFARRARSLDESLDLTQETFLRAYKGLDGFRGQAPFGAWLFRIAWNVLKSSATRAGSTWPWGRQEDPETTRTDGSPSGSLVETEPLTVDSILLREQRELLVQAIDRLPPQRRRCIVLWTYHQLTYEQIATALRISLGTVKAHMSQARRQLETLLAELMEEAQHD